MHLCCSANSNSAKLIRCQRCVLGAFVENGASIHCLDTAIFCSKQIMRLVFFVCLLATSVIGACPHLETKDSCCWIDAALHFVDDIFAWFSVCKCFVQVHSGQLRMGELFSHKMHPDVGRAPLVLCPRKCQMPSATTAHQQRCSIFPSQCFGELAKGQNCSNIR